MSCGAIGSPNQYVMIKTHDLIQQKKEAIVVLVVYVFLCLWSKVFITEKAANRRQPRRQESRHSPTHWTSVCKNHRSFLHMLQLY